MEVKFELSSGLFGLLSHEASRSFRLLVTTASSSGTDVLLEESFMKLFPQRSIDNSQVFNRKQNFTEQQLPFTWAGRLNILHSAARKSLFLTKGAGWLHM